MFASGFKFWIHEILGYVSGTMFDVWTNNLI